MAERGCLIIDDVEPCLARMTHFGRCVAEEPTDKIRSAVLYHAERRGWTVVSHRAFAAWVHAIVSQDVRPWVVLDPITDAVALGGRAVPLRLSRYSGNNDGVVQRTHFGWPCGDPSRGVGVIDDASASGRTLLTAWRVIRAAGGQITRVLVCGSARVGRESFWRTAGRTPWDDYVTGDWMIMHLRDGCPHLPSSGRLTDQPPVNGPNGPVQIRLPGTALAGSLWNVLNMNTAVRQAIMDARREIAERLSSALGRPARINDLLLLGPDIPALVDSPRNTPVGDIELTGLLPAT